MTLNEFLSKAGQLLGLAEKNLTAEQEAASLKAELEKVRGDLAIATASIGGLTEEKAKLSGEVTSLSAKIEANEKESEVKISRKAQEITASQGQPPVSATVAQTSGSGDILAEYAAIKDPMARTEWYRKNKQAYNAAFRATHPPKPE